MKRIAKLFAVLTLLAGALYAQQTPVPTPPASQTFDGVFYAPNFGKWNLQLGGAITATGSQAFLVNAGFVTTGDGLQFVPFAVNGKITVGTGSTAEIVTISAVSGCNAAALPGAPAVCTVTATSFANSHGIGEPVTSADNGSMEALAYASQTGGGEVYFLVDCGIVTLSTSGATTTSTCFIPSLYYNQGSAARVTTTITTATDWEVGALGKLASFTTANSTLTAGTTAFTTQGAYAMNLTTGATANSLVAVLITTTGTAGAGAIHVKVWGYSPAQPAF